MAILSLVREFHAPVEAVGVVPLVSIVVPNFNGRQLLKECLDSIKNLHYENYEVIVVDNSSTDGSADMVRMHYPWAVLLVTERIKMAQACNKGLALAKGDIIVTMLNNDMTVDKNWLDQQVMILARGEVGIVGGKIYDYGSDIIQTAGGMVNWKSGWSIRIGHGERDKGQYDLLREVDYVDVPTVRRDVVNRIGAIDEEYSFYYTDVDYCVRAKKAGYRVIYAPSAKMWHRSSATVGANSLRQYCSYQKDSMRFLMKNSSSSLVLYHLFRRTIATLIELSFSMSRKRPIEMRMQIAAMIWNLIRLPQTMRSRGKLPL